MNFKLGRFFYLVISVILGAFFFIFGAFSLVLPWSTFLQTAATRFIVEKTLMLSLFGLGFVLVGLSIVIYAVLHTRHRYIHIHTGAKATTLDENVIYTYVESYWKEHFPHSHVSFDLTLKKYSIQIVADLPPLSLAEQKSFLEQVKHDFGDLFERVLGYPYDVHLIASFQTDKRLS